MQAQVLPNNFNRPVEHDINYFNEICPGRVFTGDIIKEDYTHDEMKIYGIHYPDAVVEVISTGEVSKILAYCNMRKIPVTPRGAGTGLCGGCVAIYGGVVISLARMKNVVEIDKKNMTVTVEAGILLMELIEIMDKESLFYPPDPGEKSATLGGNISTNAGGMRAVKYGVTRDYVRGLTAVTADGGIMELGGKLAKNSSGYSLKDLLIGSEGTLAIITHAVLKVLPKNGVTYAGLAPFSSIEKAISVVPDIISSGLSMVAVEFMQKEVVELTKEYLGKAFPHTKAPAYLLVSMEAENDDQALEHMNEFAQLAVNLGAEDVFFADTDERNESLWVPRGAFLEAIKSSTVDLDECDVVIPIASIPAFVDYINILTAEFNVRINYFGHAGDGNLHIYCCYDGGDKDQWFSTCEKVMDRLYTKAREMGGQVSGEHGIGHAKINYLEQSLDVKQIQLMQGIKTVFDPNNILNPGKVGSTRV